MKSNTLKKEMMRKNNLFSRYLLFRYSLALFFFSNIYWLMIMRYKSTFYIVVPTILMIVIVVAIAEQFRLYSAKTVHLKWTQRALLCQAMVNILTIIFVLIPSQYMLIFPVFANTFYGKMFVILLQIFALLLIMLNFKKIRAIEANQDQFYLRFQQAFTKTYL